MGNYSSWSECQSDEQSLFPAGSWLPAIISPLDMSVNDRNGMAAIQTPNGLFPVCADAQWSDQEANVLCHQKERGRRFC